MDMRHFTMTNACWSHNWMMDIAFWDAAWEANATAYYNMKLPYSVAPFQLGYEALVFSPEGGVNYFYSTELPIHLVPNRPAAAGDLAAPVQSGAGLGFLACGGRERHLLGRVH